MRTLTPDSVIEEVAGVVEVRICNNVEENRSVYLSKRTLFGHNYHI